VACGCGKSSGRIRPTGRTRPTDQCLFCAQKHIAEAFAAWLEYTYSAENRLWIIGQLRAAVSHTYRDHAAIADMARDLAHVIQQVRDADISDDWARLAEVMQAAIDATATAIPARRAALVDARLNSRT
jgi:Asp-tRNA(Asn)/Glu-tRNA(Gln) amidotransferase B subunit